MEVGGACHKTCLGETLFLKKINCFSSSIGISSSSPNHLTFFQSSILLAIILSTPITILM